MPTTSGLTHGLLVLTALVAVLGFDRRNRPISGALTLPALAFALAIRFAKDGLGSLELGLVSGLVGLVITTGWFSFFAARKTLGWGDVRLAAVAGACLGYPKAMSAVLFISLVGAFQAVLSLLWQGRLSATVRGVLARDAEKGDAAKKHIPYGVAIALGSLGAMWWDGNAF